MPSPRIALFSAVPAILCFLLGAPWSQAEEEIDLALVLAVDISSSMDIVEQITQRAGYIDAFRDAEVIRAIKEGTIGKIAVTYVEWSSTREQIVVVPWTVIDGVASANAFADKLTKAPINRLNFTSISSALTFSAALLGARGGAALRQVIDISGDGPNNIGPPVLAARAAVMAKGITINGLPVMLPNHANDLGSLPDLDEYYRNCVIGGPSSFVLPIKAVSEFSSATRHKLLLEIAAVQPTETRSETFIRAAGPAYDCKEDDPRKL